jgi:parallel beta-helix repeat protein
VKKIKIAIFLVIYTILSSAVYAVITSTGTAGVPLLWNSPSTWDSGTIPTVGDDVVIAQGFVIIVDTAAVCTAASLTLDKYATLRFSPDGVTGSTLTISGDISCNNAAQIKMLSSHKNDVFYLSCQKLKLTENNDFVINIDTSDVNVSINIFSGIELAKNDYGSSKFEVVFSSNSLNSNVVVNTFDLTIGEDCLFNVVTSTTVNFSLYGSGKLTNNGILLVNSPGNVIFEEINNNKNMYFYNSIIGTTLDFYLGPVTNLGYVEFVGVDPNPVNTNKPDPEAVKRTISITADYILTLKKDEKSAVGMKMENVSVHHTGLWDTTTPEGYELYGIVFIGVGAPIDGAGKDYIRFYNCDISSSADTGILFRNCKRINRWWYGQGIINNVIRNCVRAGVWFKNTSKSDIRYNKIYSNIGGNVGYGIRFNGSSENEISYNDIYNNKIRGIYFEDSNKNLINSNKVYNQLAEEGISLVRSEKNVIVNNECYNNRVYGIALESQSKNNYVGANKCWGNKVGGIRVRYSSDGNIFVMNISTGNAGDVGYDVGYGFASHSSVDNLFVDEYYSDNKCGDIYIEGEENTGYISQLWLKNCFLGSTTEFANTPYKQEFTKENSWVISQNHDRTPGLTRIWGQFSMPQSAHTWHTSDILKFNYFDQLYNTKSHGWNTVSFSYDTAMLRYDDGGIDGPGGTNDISSVTTSSTTKSEVWIVTYGYGPNKDKWQVYGTKSGVQSRLLTHDEDYTSDNGEVKFRLTHRTSPISPGEQYVFVTIAESKDKNVQKVVNLCDFSDPNYIGARFENKTGATIEFVGVSTAPTMVTRKLAEDKNYNIVANTQYFYYGLVLGGTINKIEYTSFTFLNSDGLTLNSSPLSNTNNIYIASLQPATTYTTFITANNVNHTFDNIVLDTNTASTSACFNVRAKDSVLTFRDYKRPFLPDDLSNSTIYWDPTIVYSGLNGFVDDGVEPNYIDRLGSVEFQVKYFDRGLASSGNPPTTVQVWVDLNDDLIFQTTEQFGMTLKAGVGNDGDYTNGEIYNFVLRNINYPFGSIGRSGGRIKYRFYAENPYSVTIATYSYNIYSTSLPVVLSKNEASGQATEIKTFVVKGTPPKVVVETPTTEQTGLVTIKYWLFDEDDKPEPYNYCKIKVEFRDTDGNWKPATRWIASEPVENLVATLSGAEHTFIWNSTTDLPNKDVSTAIRITPEDEDGVGNTTQTGSFQVDNIIATKLVFVTAEQELLTGSTSQIIIVQAQDDVGNKDIDINGVVSLNTTSSDYAFVSSTDNVNIGNNVYMTLGEARFKYRDHQAGVQTISVSYPGLQSVSQSYWITRSVSVFLSSVTVNDSYTKYYETVVGSTVNVIITLKDVANQPAVNKQTSISVSGSQNIISQPQDKTNSLGQAFATLFSTKAELKIISGYNNTDNQTILSTSVVMFLPGSDLVVGKPSTTGSTIESSAYDVLVGSSVVITVTLKDQYGNIISSAIPSIGQKQVLVYVDNKPPEDSLVIISSYTDVNGQVKAQYTGNTTGTRTFFAKVVDFDLTLVSSVTVSFKSLPQLYATDTSSPVMLSVWPQNASKFTVAVSSVQIIFGDTGGSGISLENQDVKLYRPDGREIMTTKSLIQLNATTYIILLLFTEQEINGEYKIVSTLKDNAGNTSSTDTSVFVINIITTEEVFKESVIIYPNPSAIGEVKLKYSLMNSVNKVTLKIYNILGELVKEEQLDNTAGDKEYIWLCDNQSKQKIGSGVYICKIIVEEPSGKKYVVTKKQVVIKK